MIKVTDKEFWLDGYLKTHLDSIIHNAKDDWDFVLAVSGSGKTRVGKTMLAQQVAYYCAFQLKTPFTADNIVFTGKELIEKALKAPKNTVFIMDEARAELEAKRSLQKINQELYDFFNECGKLNHIIILVLPEFFELQSTLAVNRTFSLLNVWYKKDQRVKDEYGNEVIKFGRGHYDYYNDDTKRLLYYKGKQTYKDYRAVKPTFYGEFREKWTVDMDIYQKNKDEFMRRHMETTETIENNKWLAQRNALIKILKLDVKFTDAQIDKYLKKYGVEMPRSTIRGAHAEHFRVIETARHFLPKPQNLGVIESINQELMDDTNG